MAERRPFFRNLTTLSDEEFFASGARSCHAEADRLDALPPEKRNSNTADFYRRRAEQYGRDYHDLLNQQTKGTRQ